MLRCADVIRELSTPHAGRDADALARHVADCPDCAARAEEIQRMDRAWTATRPTEPEPEAETWRRVWSRVLTRFEAEPAVLPLTRAPRRRLLVPTLTMALVAQSAAAAIAIGWLLEHRGGPVPAPAPIPVAVSVSVAAAAAAAPTQTVAFELEPGQTLILELDERGERVVCRPRFLDTAELGAFNGEDRFDTFGIAPQGDMLVLNVMEGME